MLTRGRWIPSFVMRLSDESGRKIRQQRLETDTIVDGDTYGARVRGTCLVREAEHDRSCSVAMIAASSFQR